MGLLPRWLKNKLYLQVVSKIKDDRRRESAQIPKFDLKEKHITQTRLLESREALLHLLAKEGTVAEIGVNKGDFSEKILQITHPQKLHLIDSWGNARYHQGIQKMVTARFQKEIGQGQVEINIGKSFALAETFPDQYFDWIYIDTDHSYETTKKELESYAPKMKHGGIICGHDYILGNWNGMVRYGVVEAVAEFCTKHNWELLYITTELNNHPSFAIQKI